MKVSIYGNTLEAYIAAISLSLYGNSVIQHTKSFHSEIDEQPFLKNEPGLKSKLERTAISNNLELSDTSKFSSADIHWIFYKDKKSGELFKLVSNLLSSGETISLVISTTLGIGTFNSISNQFKSYIQEGQLRLGTLPPFIREGNAFSDFESPELLLIGTDDNYLISMLSTLLSQVIENATKVMFVSGSEAELIKTSICTMLATRLSLINELASLAEEFNIDINTVIEGIGADSRVGNSYLQPGCGFGGLTLPQEVDNLLLQFSRTSSGSEMLKAVSETNRNQKEVLFRKFWSYNKANISKLRVTIWGASFKPNSSSIDNSPIHELIEALTAQGCEINIYDPASTTALSIQYSEYLNIQLFDNKYEAAEDSDALFIVTDWKEFFEPDFILLKQRMNKPIIFDGRNIYDPGELIEFGFQYFAVGRGQKINN